MAVRAKFTVRAIKDYGYSKEVELACMYDQSIPEDQRFYRATPSGSVTMQIDNPAALEQFKIGESFYADFTPVPKSQ